MALSEIYAIGVASRAILFPVLRSRGFTLGDSDAWATVAASALVSKASANVDGKYTLSSVSGGQYLVYAFSETSFYEIEWLVPIEVKSESVSLDLHNENAISIVNNN